ncbi:protein kinase [Streptomyces gilvifuscus]|uniref:non-specific serine/threonine protein kinase n=2 Tax=Streptomyces gilvifuscus TaxID=1550617 RepID=A0ABT5FLY3_9ACTN|nr:serine/threonine protein kinase [Streptomyces gilvifuscus]MDC2953477.1 protein kinase [Streptomyces gilvifuscus]
MTGRYRLVESIGQGGMGRVWRAADEILDRPVAVKEIRIDGMDAEDTRTRRERTLREARATARIDHPNVVRVYDVVDEGERLWIVMELVRGRSLERILAEDGPLSPRETARTGLGLVAALRQVHARGVLHRDIKPGNVIVEGAGEPERRVVLTDFGIAAIQDAKALTMVGMLVGSPDYMAPERVSGRPQGPPSDIWSLGATLCAALGGRSPFSRGTTLATLHAVLYEEPELPAAAGPLSNVLAALLEKEPEARPALRELEEALRPIAFPPPTPTLPVGGTGAAEPTEEAPPPSRPTAPGTPTPPTVPAPTAVPTPEPPTPRHQPSNEPPAPATPHTRLVRATPDPRRPEPLEDAPPPARQDTHHLRRRGHTPPEPSPASAAPAEGPPAPAEGPPESAAPAETAVNPADRAEAPIAPRTSAAGEVLSELRSEAGSETPSANSSTAAPTSPRPAPPATTRPGVSLTRSPSVTRPRPTAPSNSSLHEQGTRPHLGPHPLHREPSGQAPPPGRRRRRAGLLAAAALVAAGAVVVVSLLLNSGSQGGDQAGHTTSATTPPTTSGSSPPPTVEGTSRPRTLPPGTHEEAGGYAWATPKGWKRNVMTGAEVHYTSPDGAQELVAKSSIARDDLMGTWQKSEQDAHQGQNYRKIRLEQTTFRGHSAVVWEYTFTLKGVNWHARLLGFDQEGRSYQINTWYHPDVETQAVKIYDRVKDSFTVL